MTQCGAALTCGADGYPRVTYQKNAAKKTRPRTADPRSHSVGDGRAIHSNPVSANQRTQLRMASRCLIRQRTTTHHFKVAAQALNSATPSARNTRTTAG
jgi:hypothetical protein